MKTAKLLKIFFIFTFIFILLSVSFWLRLKNCGQVPLPGQSMDEYSFSWVGLSLIELGYPVGISGIKGYPFYLYRYINVDRVFGGSGTAAGNPQKINYPWFDHPPLLGLITGGFAYLKGARVFEDTGIFLIRKPMLLLGTLSVLLVFFLGWTFYGFKEGLFASLIYATSPLVVVGSRLVQAENGMIPFFLLSVILLNLYYRKNKEFLLWLAAFCAGLSPLFKVSGVVAILAGIALILIKSRESRSKLLADLAIFGVVSLSLFSTFFLYGAFYDRRLFSQILQSNTSRFYGLGSNAVYSLLTTTRITHNKFLTDAWPLVGWLSLAALSFAQDEKKKRKISDQLLIILTLLYLAIYLFFGSEQYGWYHFPFWPLLAVASGRVLGLAWENSSLMATTFFFLLLPIGAHLSKLLDINQFQKLAPFWRLTTLSLFLLFLIPVTLVEKIKVLRFWHRVFLLALFGLAIYLNLKYLSLLNVDYWYHAT